MASGSESYSSINRARQLGVTGASRRRDTTPNYGDSGAPF